MERPCCAPLRSGHAPVCSPRPSTAPFGRPAASAHGAERLPVLIFDDPAELATQAARRVRTLIEARQAAGDTAVLGLPTGSTPIGVYQELIRMHRALLPGAYDEREFWERARDRNTATAHALDALGLPECYAAEAFVTVREMP